ncbi:LysR family transcriptional regulator [uncultured Megasphaera sp.]|uniref:LysR family transcriptional regulator n=1 Tax=uncultured Megasphaera sp. TaxID=165188 RepID=UPI00266C8271|nr:LysR family transcriptional regulator [uncultured Megasphaera sp.]
MNLKQLQYFLKLAETEHYRKAAESLFITEPSLNRAIREMEKELGIQLFEKRGRNIFLNKYGHLFLPYVKRSLQELERGVDLMKAYTRPDQGKITLGFIYTMGYTLVPEMITQFQAVEGNDGITFDFHQGTTAALIKELKEEKIDAALCSSVENEPDVLFYPVAEEELVVAVPKGHPLSNRGSVSLKELEPYPVIAFDKSSGLNEMINKLLDQAQVHLKTACHVEEDNAMAGFVAAGYGVAILPDFYTLQYYNLDRIPIADSFERRYLFLALLRQSQVLPVVERFRNFLLSRWQRGAL